MLKDIPTSKYYKIYKERGFSNWTSISIIRYLKEEDMKGICFITKYTSKKAKLFVFTKNKLKSINDFTENDYVEYTGNFDEVIKHELISKWMIEF